MRAVVTFLRQLVQRDASRESKKHCPAIEIDRVRQLCTDVDQLDVLKSLKSLGFYYSSDCLWLLPPTAESFPLFHDALNRIRGVAAGSDCAKDRTVRRVLNRLGLSVPLADKEKLIVDVLLSLLEVDVS